MPDRPGPTPLDFAHDAVGHGCFAVDLDGQVHSFVASVRDALLSSGVLHKDGDEVWRLHWRSHGDGSDLLHDLGDWMACCDFCSARPVCWNIPCETFAMPDLDLDTHTPGPPATSVGDWAACEACGTAIEAGQRRQLLARTLAAHGRTRVHRLFQEQLHRRFWQHYQGGAVRVAPHPFGH